MRKESIYTILPNSLQNAIISLYNLQAYRKRYGGKYKYYRKYFSETDNLSREELIRLQDDQTQRLIDYTRENSDFYRDKYRELDISNLRNLPILSKEELRSNLDSIYTIQPNSGIISKTGGTTGTSMTVYYTPQNIQERFALLDNFRASHGYELGKKTAWFSGKKLLCSKDIKRNQFWKTDYLHKVRYYSTFHINQKYLKYYVENLIKYSPEFLVGFPSSIAEIARYGLENGYSFPGNTVKAVFPTAESLTPDIRKVIETFFKTKMYDQYASSEGAPFIFECEEGNLHMDLRSGVFEVLDDDDNPSTQGRLVVTSFSTYGTPLIRYDIGDCLELGDGFCSCKNQNPLVRRILGRIDDYIFSPETGKINVVNVCNATKGVNGILKFQVVQNTLESIEITAIVEPNTFTKQDEIRFLNNWKDRVGNMDIVIRYEDEIPVEKSGKYRIVKNNIKKLVETR